MSVIIVAPRRCSPRSHPRIDSTRSQPIGRISPPSDETLCVYYHFLVECLCVRRPPKKKVLLEAADGTHRNLIIRPSLISMTTPREVNWYFRMWMWLLSRGPVYWL